MGNITFTMIKPEAVEAGNTGAILNRIEESYSDEKAGYPPNCNKGYVEKNGKCVPE